MTGPSSNKAAHSVTKPLSRATELGAQVESRVKPVQIWAVIGGAVLILQLYVWIRWVSGPYFARVPAGPSDPPTLMKVLLMANMIVLSGGLPVGIWWFIVRPWRRERRITLDGMLLVSTGLMVFQDPLLNYFNTWCTYNTWVWNRGAWTPHIPGWVSPDHPGRQVAEPLLAVAPGYSYGVLLCTIVGCWVMRKAKARWPNISNLRLIGVTYAFTVFFDLVMEGCILTPTGVFTYPGAIRAVSINAGHYYQYPIYEAMMWGGAQAALCCLRYFTDDRGRTMVERGLDRIQVGFAKQQFIRFLAIFAAVSACFFVFYNVPAQWFGMHADPWPEDILKRSYFTGGICGAGTDRLCPDPALPIPTRHSGYINIHGELVLPEGVQLPKVVPFKPGN